MPILINSLVRWKPYFVFFFLQINCIKFLHYTRLGSHLTFVIVFKLLYVYFIESWITSEDIATELGTGRRGVRIPARARGFSPIQNVQTVPGAPPPRLLLN